MNLSFWCIEERHSRWLLSPSAEARLASLGQAGQPLERRRAILVEALVLRHGGMVIPVGGGGTRAEGRGRPPCKRQLGLPPTRSVLLPLPLLRD